MKKILSFLLVGILVCTLSALPAFAADHRITNSSSSITSTSLSTNYFSGSTGKMNSFNGSQSRVFNISSGSIPNGAVVSNVSLNVTVSRGSSPFYIVIKAPNGYYAEKYISSSGSVSSTEFNGYDPYGTWQVYIYTSGTVSTATARMRVNYNY